jgi:hypothetical protein
LDADVVRVEPGEISQDFEGIGIASFDLIQSNLEGAARTLAGDQTQLIVVDQVLELLESVFWAHQVSAQ